MPQSIPPGLLREHVLAALSDIDAGVEHPFGQPTGYFLVHDAKRHAPKAVAGLACRYPLYRMLYALGVQRWRGTRPAPKALSREMVGRGLCPGSSFQNRGKSYRLRNRAADETSNGAVDAKDERSVEPKPAIPPAGSKGSKRPKSAEE